MQLDELLRRFGALEMPQPKCWMSIPSNFLLGATANW